MRNSKKISATLFALILVCFLMPFLTISCENSTILQVSGIEMVVGRSLKESLASYNEEFRKLIDPLYLTAAAFVAAGIGLGGSFIETRISSFISSITAIFGALMLLFVKLGFDKQLTKEAESDVNWGIGFWSAFLLFSLSAILNGWIATRKRIGKQEDSSGN